MLFKIMMTSPYALIKRERAVISTETHEAPAECVQWRNPYRPCVIMMILSLCIVLSGCKQAGNATLGQTEQDDTVKVTTPKFTHPDVPTVIIDPNMQLEYLVKHYWDHFDFADTSYIPTPDITEQAWVDYVDLLFRIPHLQKAQEEMKNMMTKSALNSKKLFEYFTGLADKYLYDPNSPSRNEELYIPVLEVMLQTFVLNDVEKIRPQMRLDWALKNRMGAQATNFQFTGIAGQTGTLYQVNTAFTLLFFNNPECTSCIEHIEGLRRSMLINSLLSERRLSVLSIYPDHEVDNEWKKNYAVYPAEWIVGYDPSFTIGDKYDLKASPTLYLLDKDKTVLLKDATIPLIENYLAYMLQQN